MKAILKYPGSKWGIARWIISFFPEHHSYLEPFAGSLAVLMNKERSNIETVNDLDGNVVNLFEWIRRDPERLAREIYYTPYARQVYEDAFSAEPEDGFRRAVDFSICLNMGHGFRTNGEKVGWKNDVRGRERAYAAQDWRSLPERIMEAAERLRGVQIENRPAVELIKRFNYENVLVYCDPPYMLGTRHGKQYRHEMDDKGHEELLEAVLGHKGKVILSGYDTALYNSRLKGWHREESDCRSQVGSRKREVLWLNFEPAQQMTLQDYGEKLE
ncbi:MAG: DNA adenine methylase [Dorea sp.]|jgi:DNA adenine methylase|nr:DNA adenine methylase [Dorea sp.]MCI9249768.1 DNA adenine methylase [Dorea sp.]